MVNPVHKIKIRAREKGNFESKNPYKAIPPEERDRFLNALEKATSNFIKPMCYLMMFAGLRSGETIALECGMDIKSLSDILGHKNPTITLTRYAHSMMSYKKTMMNKISKLYQS